MQSKTQPPTSAKAFDMQRELQLAGHPSPSWNQASNSGEPMDYYQAPHESTTTPLAAVKNNTMGRQPGDFPSDDNS